MKSFLHFINVIKLFVTVKYNIHSKYCHLTLTRVCKSRIGIRNYILKAILEYANIYNIRVFFKKVRYFKQNFFKGKL